MAKAEVSKKRPTKVEKKIVKVVDNLLPPNTVAIVRGTVNFQQWLQVLRYTIYNTKIPPPTSIRLLRSTEPDALLEDKSRWKMHFRDNYSPELCLKEYLGKK